MDLTLSVSAAYILYNCLCSEEVIVSSVVCKNQMLEPMEGTALNAMGFWWNTLRVLVGEEGRSVWGNAKGRLRKGERMAGTVTAVQQVIGSLGRIKAISYHYMQHDALNLTPNVIVTTQTHFIV